MRILKLFVLTLVIFGLLILALSLLFPSNVRISRAINIAAPKENVRQQLAKIDQWPGWNVMVGQELTNVVVSDSSFSSDQMKIRLLSVSPDTIRTHWKRGSHETIQSGFTLMYAADSTVVQWYFDFKLNWYPWEKFGSIVFDKQLGPVMETSLSNLKKFMENSR